MKKRGCISKIGRFAAGLVLFSSLLPASTIVATGVDWSRGESFWIQENGNNTAAYFGGVIFITLMQDGIQYNRESLCVDLFTDILIGQTYNTFLMHPDQVLGKSLPRVSWLVDNALLPTEKNGIPVTSELPNTDWVNSAAQGAGIQFAIWDIVHDGGDGFSQGSVQASSDVNNPTDAAVLAWAQLYESLSAGKSSGLAYIYQNTDGNGTPAQMLAGPQFQDGGPHPNPEPATTAMAGGAMIGLAWMLRKANRRRG